MAAPDAKDYSLSRAVLLTEGYKGLLIINGGGAAALLAFIAQIVSKSTELAQLSFIGVALMALGLGFASLIPFFRYHHSKIAEKLEKSSHSGSKKTIYWCLYTSCQYLSVAFFVGALLYIVINGLPVLDTIEIIKCKNS